MTRRLPPQDWMVAPATTSVLDALEGVGAQVRFVGGCVRDALLDRPVSDIDIATDAVPQRVTEALEAAGVKVVPTGLSHGTVTAVAHGHPFEITTLRRDVETDGRHATVAFTDDWMEDAARRDFTINALSLSRDGRVHDPFGGEEDLRHGRVRFVGDPIARMTEDVLRLLRFFRFHAYYGAGDLDPDGLAACRTMAPELRRLSAERVWSELRNLLSAPDPPRILRAMTDAGVLSVVLPEASEVDRLARLIEAEAVASKQWPAVVTADPVRRLAVLLAVDRDGAEAVGRRLRLSTAGRERLVAIVDGLHHPPTVVDAPRIRQAVYRMTRDRFVDIALAHWAAADKDRPWRQALAAAAEWTAPKFPLSGKDVTALGVPRGPRIGDALRAVEQWWISEDFRPTREACLARLRHTLKD